MHRLPHAISIWENARIAAMHGTGYGLLDHATLVTDGELIAWVGPSADLPPSVRANATRVYDCDGRCITPGLIDCHTHLVHAGNRARDFIARMNGTNYVEIARQDGGILSTVRSTRAADQAALYDAAECRLRALLAEGVTTVEIKSGYGLDRETELRCLRVARELGRRNAVNVRTTYLGLHAPPPEFENPDAYVDFTIAEVLPTIAEECLADAVDAYCEPIAFSNDQIARFFEAATGLGLRVKLHADQFTACGAAETAARFGALSVDHLEHARPQDAAALARAGTVAVLLPGAYYYLRERVAPPIDTLRRLGVPIALATDYNPGTSPMTSLLLVLNLACVIFGLTPQEALLGVTRNAARALGMEESIGTLEIGKRADFVVWDIASPDELAATIGMNPSATIVHGGYPVKDGIA